MATRATKKKLVLVGHKTLSADLLKFGDPIVEGEELELSGAALEYAQNLRCLDANGSEINAFEEPSHFKVKRLRGEVDEQPARRRRRRTQ